MNQAATGQTKGVSGVGVAARPVSTQSAVLARLWCRALFLPLYYGCTLLMRLSAGYTFDDLTAVRRRYREIAEEGGPLLICANHLTIIDSALMLWAFGSGTWYLRHFHRFSWNLPAGDFFKKKLFYRVMGAISKCLFIHRDGSKEHKDSVLSVCAHLARSGEVVTFFPEGKRSRTGRFDPTRMTYGIGKVVSELGACRVLCVYLRGDRQETYSNYPSRGSRFHLETRLLHLSGCPSGREGYQQVVSAVASEIKAMEDAYFARRANDGERHAGRA